MHPNAEPRSTRLLLAGLCLATIAAAFAATSFHRQRGLPVPEWPLAFDFFVMLPLAYLWLLKPDRKAALAGILGIVSFGVLVGSFVLPAQDKLAWLWLERARWPVLALAIGWQLWTVIEIAKALWTAAAHDNVEQRLHAAIERRVGTGPMSGLLKLEGRVWLYALCRNPARLAFAEGRTFSVHRQGSNASNQLGFLILMAVELPVVHVLIHLFSPLAATVVTALTVYGMLFMLADHRATLLRPIGVSKDCLHLRHGVVADLRLPLSAIVEASRHTAHPKRAPGRIRLIGMGKANVRIELAEGTRLSTLTGEREVREIFLGVDEPEAFLQAIRAKA